ncbi:MAG: response regulator transcription factor [Candidatus Sericytochromatia bacterium]|nr:response regulator transcription factor [Candidatus Sericytochromatia bacterium]
MAETQSPPKGARVLLVEDDPLIADVLATELRLEGFQVEVASDGLRGLLAARQQEPDLIILDRMLPQLNGTELCQRLRQSSNVPIIMLTAMDSLQDRVEGLNFGANDYLSKPFALVELIARINAQLRSHSPPERRVLIFADLRLDLDSHEAWRGEQPVALTPKEFDLLGYLMAHPRQVKSREQILEAVWHYDFDGENNVVDVYIRYLRTKIERPDQQRLIHTVRGVGYILREEVAVGVT